jgi:hypothetical protein
LDAQRLGAFANEGSEQVRLDTKSRALLKKHAKVGKRKKEKRSKTAVPAIIR